MEQSQVTPFREYPFYEFLEAGMTEQQFNSLASHLIRNAGEDEIAGARGIGEKKAREIRDALDGVESVAKRAVNRSIDDF